MTPFPNLTGCAGAAFLLSSSPGEDITFNHPEGCVSLRQSAPHITVSLAATMPPEMIRATAWRVVQESLDVLAATGRTALTTSKGDTEYLLWEFVDDLYDLTCVSTAEFQWSMEASAKVGPSTVHPPPLGYTHHEALRFYRMSKCTSDLFDAYRNAYLGLECLVIPFLIQ